MALLRTFSWAWGNVIKEHVKDTWKKTLERFVYNIKGFEKDEEIAKISKAVVEIAWPTLTLRMTLR